MAGGLRGGGAGRGRVRAPPTRVPPPQLRACGAPPQQRRARSDPLPALSRERSRRLQLTAGAPAQKASTRRAGARPSYRPEEKPLLPAGRGREPGATAPSFAQRSKGGGSGPPRKRFPRTRPTTAGALSERRQPARGARHKSVSGTRPARTRPSNRVRLLSGIGRGFRRRGCAGARRREGFLQPEDA